MVQPPSSNLFRTQQSDVLGSKAVGQAVWALELSNEEGLDLGIHGEGGKAGELHIYVDTLLQTNESQFHDVFDFLLC